MNKTTTIYDGEFPSVTLIPGSFGVKDFNQAFYDEDPKHHRQNAWAANELRKEFWRWEETGWVKSTKGDDKAQVVTIVYWMEDVFVRTPIVRSS